MGGAPLAEPSSSPSETPGRHSASQPHLTASLVSFHHQSLSHHLIFFLLMLKLTTALICRYDATPPLLSKKNHFSSPICRFSPCAPPVSPLFLSLPVLQSSTPLTRHLDPRLFTTYLKQTPHFHSPSFPFSPLLILLFSLLPRSAKRFGLGENPGGWLLYEATCLNK